MKKKKLLETSCHFLMAEFWRGLTLGLGRSREDGKDPYCRDYKIVAYKMTLFANEIKDYHNEILRRLKDSCVEIEFSPKAWRERSKMGIKLSVNLATGIGHIFFRSKIGLSRGDYVHMISEDIHDVDISASLEDLRGFLEKYPEYEKQAEAIIEEKRTEEIKQKKLAEMASKSIETIVPQMMSQSGYEWNLESEYKYFGTGGTPERYILRIKTKKHKMIEITLNKNNFAEKIPEILNVVKQIEQLLEQAPFAVNIVNYGPGTRWIKGTENVKESP